MGSENHWKTFISQKVSKLRWSLLGNGDRNNTEFITGSWDDAKNSVTQWKIPDDSVEDGGNPEPFVLNQVLVNGSVTDLAFLSEDRLICSTSSGHVTLLSLRDVDGDMSVVHTWEKIHAYKATQEAAPCCAVTTNGTTIVSGGEDGRINLLQVGHKKPIKTVENADNSNITAMLYLNSKEFASINTTGQLKIWDSFALEKPVKTLTLSGNACPLLSIDKHPNQPHILVTGHGDGVVGIWDVRQDKTPVTLIDAHEAEVWQVQFHPLYPDNLFTCSEDGSCWFWNGASMNTTSMKGMNETASGLDLAPSDLPSSSSIWLHVDANKHRMETFSLIPFNKSAVNCFDVCGNSLICGTDGEAIIVVNDIPVR